MELESQSSIFKSIEKSKNINITKEDSKNTEQTNSKNIMLNKNNILPKKNIQSQFSQIPSKAQIYHYEKTIHDLTLQNESLSSRIEKLLLQLEKSSALIDSHKTENNILKTQLINQANNTKNLEEKNKE